MKIIKINCLVTLLVVLTSTQQIHAGDYSSRPEALKFIEMMSTKHNFNKAEIKSIVDNMVYKQKIIDAISRPAESVMTWERYRPIFLGKSRIDGGVTFWKENSTQLKKAENQYGVPAEVIVAILGVETRYNKHAGSYRVIDSLATLGFDYPKRGKFFLGQLEQFFLLSREEKIDPLTAKGSYAGAIGMAQFIPSSYRHYSIDFDGDNQRNLLTSNADAIGSIANYLGEHGWVNQQPITTEADVSSQQISTVVSLGLKPKKTLKELSQYGVTPKAKLPFPSHLVSSLIELETKSGNEYWLGFHNFYVITRYNHSPLYAMAVFQLSEEIKLAYKN